MLSAPVEIARMPFADKTSSVDQKKKRGEMPDFKTLHAKEKARVESGMKNSKGKSTKPLSFNLHTSRRGSNSKTQTQSVAPASTSRRTSRPSITSGAKHPSQNKRRSSSVHGKHAAAARMTPRGSAPPPPPPRASAVPVASAATAAGPGPAASAPAGAAAPSSRTKLGSKGALASSTAPQKRRAHHDEHTDGNCENSPAASRVRKSRGSIGGGSRPRGGTASSAFATDIGAKKKVFQTGTLSSARRRTARTSVIAYQGISLSKRRNSKVIARRSMSGIETAARLAKSRQASASGHTPASRALATPAADVNPAAALAAGNVTATKNVGLPLLPLSMSPVRGVDGLTSLAGTKTGTGAAFPTTFAPSDVFNTSDINISAEPSVPSPEDTIPGSSFEGDDGIDAELVELLNRSGFTVLPACSRREELAFIDALRSDRGAQDPVGNLLGDAPDAQEFDLIPMRFENDPDLTAPCAVRIPAFKPAASASGIRVPVPAYA